MQYQQMEPFKLENKVVVITGAANGIGSAIAKTLHQQGAIIVAVDLDEDSLKKLAADLDHKRIMIEIADITSYTSLQEIRNTIHKSQGKVDLVIANAGIACDPPSTFRKMTNEVFERIVEVDLFGVTRVVKVFLEDIIDNKGHILVTSSVYAFTNGALNSPYASSKAAIEMFTRSLRAELAGTGATAGVLYPGWVRTDISKSVQGDHDIATKLKQRLFVGPLGHFITPNQVAEQALRGIVRRKPRIFAPNRWTPLSLLRGFLSMATDNFLDRDKFFQTSIKEIEDSLDNTK